MGKYFNKKMIKCALNKNLDLRQEFSDIESFYNKI